MRLQDPKDVATDTARDLSALVGELGRPKSRRSPLSHRLKDTHAAVEAAVVEAEGKDERGAVS
jgi:hypothetical protein